MLCFDVRLRIEVLLCWPGLDFRPCDGHDNVGSFGTNENNVHERAFGYPMQRGRVLASESGKAQERGCFTSESFPSAILFAVQRDTLA